jgi:hypothetical protein
MTRPSRSDRPEYPKEKNPMVEVTVRDLLGEEETIVIPSQRPK